MAAKTLSIATAAPWSNRGKSRDSRSECDDLEGEWRRKPLLHHTPESTLSQASYGVTQAYGCAEGSSSQNILNRVPEESGPDEDDSCSEENDEYELEERGLHRGKHMRRTCS
jgi:hypothetical protein